MTDVNDSVDFTNEALAPVQEKMIPVSEASKHIAGAKMKAYEKAKNEFDDRIRALEEKISQNNLSSASNQPQQSQAVFSKDLLREELQSLIREEQSHLAQARQQEEANKIVRELSEKFKKAEERLPDFKDTITSFKFENTPEILRAANQFDNGGEILYDLAKNPSKIGALLALADRDPDAMIRQMRDLSSSIQKNEQAKNTKFPQDPIQSIRPSVLGTDNGDLSPAELLRQAKLKYRG
jgi:capsule polysaccharide export protein KpsE/RkpR